MAKNRGRDLIVNTIVIAIGKFSTQIVSFLLLPLYTTILTTSEYGIYDLVITISTFLLPVITLLMEESMFRFLIDCKTDVEKKIIISQSFLYIIKSSTIFAIIGIIVGFAFKIPYLLIGLIYIFTCVISGLRNSLVRGLGKIKFYTLVNFISSLINILCNILFIAVFKYGVYGLLISGIISNLMSTLIVLFKINLFKYISFKAYDRKLTNEMIKYSLPLVPNSLSWTIVNLSDRLVISSFMGTSYNGIYSMSYKFPNLMNTMYGFFYTAWKESSARAINDDDKEIFFNKIYSILTKAMFSISLGIIAILPLLFSFFIKKSFAESYVYIPILVLSMYYNNMSGYFGGIFSGYKDTKIMGITTVWGAIINLVVNLALIKFIGIYAAAISTLVSCMIIYYYRRIKIKKYLNIENVNLLLGIIILTISLASYYINDNILLKIIILLVSLLYCFYENKEMINLIFDKFLKKYSRDIKNKM